MPEKLETESNMREQLHNLLDVLHKQNPYQTTIVVRCCGDKKQKFTLNKLFLFYFEPRRVVESVRMRLQ